MLKGLQVKIQRTNKL